MVTGVTGSNAGYMDGSARWTKFEAMLFLRSWCTTGDPDAGFFEADLPPGFEKQIARLRPHP